MAQAGKFQPSWVLMMLLAVATMGSLLAINVNAEYTVPALARGVVIDGPDVQIATHSKGADLEELCRNVQCPVECPSDSVMVQHLESDTVGPDVEVEDPLYQEHDNADVKQKDSQRARRSIAMNNHPHESIKITPNGDAFIHQNQLPAQRSYRLWKRDLQDHPAAADNLETVCCQQRCACLPCPTQTCPRHYVAKLVARAPAPTGQPGSCCPQIYCERDRRCRSVNFPEKTFSEGERWNEDPCLECRCEAGENRCEMPSCKPLGCTKTINLPDKCCPVCDETDSIMCPGHANCAFSCRHGFQRRESGCLLCACLKKPMANATTTTSTVLPTPSTSNSTPTSMDFSVLSTSSAEPSAPQTTSTEVSSSIEHLQQPSNTVRMSQDNSHSTYASPVDHKDSSNTFTTIFGVAAGGLMFFGAFGGFGYFLWSLVQKRRQGKYSTVPVSSTASTITPSPARASNSIV